MNQLDSRKYSVCCDLWQLVWLHRWRSQSNMAWTNGMMTWRTFYEVQVPMNSMQCSSLLTHR